MMPMTHLVAAVGAAGWLMGPSPVGLVLAVAGAVLPDVNELQTMMGYRLSGILDSWPVGEASNCDRRQKGVPTALWRVRAPGVLGLASGRVV